MKRDLSWYLLKETQNSNEKEDKSKRLPGEPLTRGRTSAAVKAVIRLAQKESAKGSVKLASELPGTVQKNLGQSKQSKPSNWWKQLEKAPSWKTLGDLFENNSFQRKGNIVSLKLVSNWSTIAETQMDSRKFIAFWFVEYFKDLGFPSKESGTAMKDFQFRIDTSSRRVYIIKS
jgi:hypothetical protein